MVVALMEGAEQLPVTVVELGTKLSPTGRVSVTCRSNASAVAVPVFVMVTV